MVDMETATVLSYKVDQKTSQKFLDEFLKLDYEKIWFTSNMEPDTLELFKKQTT